MKTFKNWIATAGLLTLAGAAQAGLVSRGNGMIYDTTRNITWLADMNYAFTSGYVAGGVSPFSAFGSNVIWTDGRMGWDAAQRWAENLDYAGYDDWRLPTLIPWDTSCVTPFGGGIGYNCRGGELSGLLVTDLGNRGGSSVLAQTGDTAEQIANQALFSNLQSDIYWSGTEDAVNAPNGVWAFYTFEGRQYQTGKDWVSYAVAVRSGDVMSGVSHVPEPQSLALTLAALVGLGSATRWRRSAWMNPQSMPKFSVVLAFSVVSDRVENDIE